jgi:hypothetical protein
VGISFPDYACTIAGGEVGVVFVVDDRPFRASGAHENRLASAA